MSHKYIHQGISIHDILHFCMHGIQLSNYILICYLHNLFYFSIVFLIGPIVFNSALAFLILMRELSKNTKFQEWFSQNVRIVSVLTLLAGADVESITILGSKFAGWQIFSAPLSLLVCIYGIVTLLLRTAGVFWVCV